MKKLVILCLSVFMAFGFVGVASADLTFDLDFGQDGIYETYWGLAPSEVVFIDLYVSGVPAGEPIYVDPYPPGDPVPIVGLCSMGLDIIYDPYAVEITAGTEFKMELIGGGVDTSTPGHIFMQGMDAMAMLLGRDGHFGDDILVATIEFHCIAPTGITELWLYDLDHGEGFDDWVLFDGAVLDGDISAGVKLAEINQVPIPGAIWLLGSGILGLIGLRRRAKKA